MRRTGRNLTRARARCSPARWPAPRSTAGPPAASAKPWCATSPRLTAWHATWAVPMFRRASGDPRRYRARPAAVWRRGWRRSGSRSSSVALARSGRQETCDELSSQVARPRPSARGRRQRRGPPGRRRGRGHAVGRGRGHGRVGGRHARRARSSSPWPTRWPRSATSSSRSCRRGARSRPSVQAAVPGALVAAAFHHLPAKELADLDQPIECRRAHLLRPPEATEVTADLVA